MLYLHYFLNEYFYHLERDFSWYKIFMSTEIKSASRFIPTFNNFLSSICACVCVRACVRASGRACRRACVCIHVCLRACVYVLCVTISRNQNFVIHYFHNIHIISYNYFMTLNPLYFCVLIYVYIWMYLCTPSTRF